MVTFTDWFGPTGTPFIHDRLTVVNELGALPDTVRAALEGLLGAEGPLEELLPLQLIAHHYQGSNIGDEDLILIYKPGRHMEREWDAARNEEAFTVWDWIMNLPKPPL